MSDARTVHVVAPNRAGAHPSLESALAAAKDGDLIQVQPGKYSGSLRITKDVEIVGIGSHEDVELTTDRDSLIHSTARNLILTNLTLKGKVRTQPVIHIASGNLDIKYSSVEGGKYSIASDIGTRISVTSCYVADSERGAVCAKNALDVRMDNSLIERSGGSGLIAEGCQEVRVTHCTINDTTPHAIECSGQGLFEVVDTEFTSISHAQILDNFKPVKFDNDERAWYTRKQDSEAGA
ncbi:MAG: right-handed parallel beta-helix repeat-containing protein [Calditrichaeota bacterium]|nr:right-handed parallel beta-helix repeat-containing protein [Calditrichota bacterium]MCB9369446.1 right-handed parallel beta-helix repeat-containing protein [Calditrichota bacterium]